MEKASVCVHADCHERRGTYEHLGYRMVGWFTNCGYKIHRWYNLAWMEKEIGEHVADQPPVIAFMDIVEDISLQNGELRL